LLPSTDLVGLVSPQWRGLVADALDATIVPSDDDFFAPSSFDLIVAMA